MIHNEHLRKADESYEIRMYEGAGAIHVYIKDGCAIIYPTLNDLVRHVYFGESTERFYVLEKDLEDLYKSGIYDYYKLKQYDVSAYKKHIFNQDTDFNHCSDCHY